MGLGPGCGLLLAGGHREVHPTAGLAAVARLDLTTAAATALDALGAGWGAAGLDAVPAGG